MTYARLRIRRKNPRRSEWPYYYGRCHRSTKYVIKIARRSRLSSEMQSEIFPALLRRLGDQEPPVGSSRRASVAVILNSREAPKLLLIKRAEMVGDPWSGQVAFPGGKSQEADGTARDTAIRETREEVGIDLSASSEFLGYFRSFRTHTGTMEVIPSLFLLRGTVAVRTNEEVSSYRWVGLDRLLSSEASSSQKVNFQGKIREVPAFRVGDYIVWGLTHSIISSLLSAKTPTV